MKNLIDYINNKIISLRNINSKINKFPRNTKITLCHGVFDIVHPGHIRHLMYAKNKSEKLLVSVTPDIYINKGSYRPNIPQYIRALNIASLSFVDYVLIEYNNSSLRIIKKIMPDFYSKGYEYTPSKYNSKTLDELYELKSYGGQMIFTSNDYINSSTQIIKKYKLNNNYEKLFFLMKNNNIAFETLFKTLKHFKDKHVHVVGDTIIDTHTKASIIGGNVKTPTMSVLYNRHVDYIGGAAIVAKHIAASGSKTTFTTVIGEDKYTEFIKKDMNKNNIDINIIYENRPTNNKNVIIVNNYRLFKIDTINNNIINNMTIYKIKKYIKNVNSDGVIFSDFRHGIFNKKNIKIFFNCLDKNTYKSADSQVASRWGNILQFKGFDLVTPNEKEARFSLADQESNSLQLSKKIYNLSSCKLLLLKLGPNGLIVYNKNNKGEEEYFTIGSFVNKLLDPVGSGDALLAYSMLSKISKSSDIVSAILGSIAASCECEQDGNIPIDLDKVILKIQEIKSKIKYIHK